MNNKLNKQDMEVYAELMRGLPVVLEDTSSENESMWDRISDIQELLNSIQNEETQEND